MKGLLRVAVLLLLSFVCAGCGAPAIFYVWSATRAASSMLDDEHENEQDGKIQDLEEQQGPADPNEVKDANNVGDIQDN